MFFGCVIQMQTKAQVNVNLNVGRQPVWGPIGYDRADYYYLPDIDAYYDVSKRQFVYPENGRWITDRNLPVRYKGYDLYNGYKVVINEPNPYLQADKNRERYGKYKGWKGPRQVVIRDRRDEKFRKKERDDDDRDEKYKKREHDEDDRKDHKEYKNKGKGKGHEKRDD